MTFEKLETIARAEVEIALAELPPRIRETVEKAQITFEQRPDADDIATGVAPDTLGLFDEGPPDIPLPHIRLWLDNIYGFARESGNGFREEVRITLLHEIGHLLGWEEDDLEERELE